MYAVISKELAAQYAPCCHVTQHHQQVAMPAQDAKVFMKKKVFMISLNSESWEPGVCIAWQPAAAQHCANKDLLPCLLGPLFERTTARLGHTAMRKGGQAL